MLEMLWKDLGYFLGTGVMLHVVKMLVLEILCKDLPYLCTCDASWP